MLIDRSTYFCAGKNEYDYYKGIITTSLNDSKIFNNNLKNLYTDVFSSDVKNSYIFTQTSKQLYSKIKINLEVLIFLMNKLKEEDDGEQSVYEIFLKDNYYRFVFAHGVLFSITIQRDGTYGEVVINLNKLQEDNTLFGEILKSPLAIELSQIIIFLKYGDVELKLVESGKKIGTKRDGYYNTTSNNMTVVDSSWNKIIIRTEKFNVNGHLRLQPIGKNRKDRKLIWINPFYKLGYKKIGKGVNK